MNNKQINKTNLQYKRKLDKEHKTLFNNIRSKLRRLKLKRQDKKALIADIKHANGDLMHLLATEEQPKTVSEYFQTINAYLTLEMETYDYNGVILAYVPTKMAQLMQIITNQHKLIDLREKIRESVLPTNAV